jgi:hypothetical protein
VANEASSYFSQRASAISFLRAFLEALGNRDWLVIESSFHPHAALFSAATDSQRPSMLQWDIAAPHFKRWLEKGVGIRTLPPRVEELEVTITGTSAIITLPAKRRVPGTRVMILTSEAGDWVIRHLHLDKLGIDMGEVGTAA